MSSGAESRGSLGRESQLAEDRKRESRAAEGGGAWVRGSKVVLSMELVQRGGRGQTHFMQQAESITYRS